MSLRIVSNNNQPYFKGSQATTDSGAQYYKTNNGLKVGATLGTVGLVGGLLQGGLIGSAVCMGIHSGIGAFLDYKRNNNAAEAADYIKKVGAKRAILSRDDIYISTTNGQPYYHSNVGAKYGTAIGAAYGAIVGILPSSVLTALGLGKLKSKELALGGIILFASLTAFNALGGFILGKITDYFTNKAAEKNA